jgi:acyl-CoA reductase-like NAD-dependent aldehyde dehydrogenase
VFGPVVTIAAFDDDEDAIRSANDTRYGLNAMVFTRHPSRAHRASAALVRASSAGSVRRRGPAW